MFHRFKQEEKLVTPETIKADFKTPEALTSYVSSHRLTPRALIHVGHLTLMGYIAGWDISKQPVNVFADKQFVSLHEYNSEQLCKDALRRIENREVPADWIERCFAEIAKH